MEHFDGMFLLKAHQMMDNELTTCEFDLFIFIFDILNSREGVPGPKA